MALKDPYFRGAYQQHWVDIDGYRYQPQFGPIRFNVNTDLNKKEAQVMPNPVELKINAKDAQSRQVTVKAMYSSQYYRNNGYGAVDAADSSALAVSTIKINGNKIDSMDSIGVSLRNVDPDTLRNMAKLFSRLADLLEEVDMERDAS